MERSRNNYRGFGRGLVVGLAVGLICTAAAGSWAAMNKMHWDKRNGDFQTGYVAGFIDVVRIFQARHPETAMAKEFSIPPTIPPHVWAERVNALYADEEYEEAPLTQIILIAGVQLSSETGYERSMGNAGSFEAYRKLVEQRMQARNAERAAQAEEAGTSESAPGADEPKDTEGTEPAAD